MLSAEDNDQLCKVGPGSVGGNLIRQYWLPALMSSELPEAGWRSDARSACWART